MFSSSLMFSASQMYSSKFKFWGLLQWKGVLILVFVMSSATAC